jgi:hypothetical protein
MPIAAITPAKQSCLRLSKFYRSGGHSDPVLIASSIGRGLIFRVFLADRTEVLIQYFLIVLLHVRLSNAGSELRLISHSRS